MKKIISLALVFLSFQSLAEVCSVQLADRFGNVAQVFTESGYTRFAACDEANYQCNRALSDGRVNGRYYDHFCQEIAGTNYPPIPTPPTPPRMETCTTDLLDQFGRIVRTFTGNGRSQYDACMESDRFCYDQLNRRTSMGVQCVRRNGYPTPVPPPNRNRTETCQFNRYDPAGFLIQTYVRHATGPIHIDVKGEACRHAQYDCQRDLKGRQYCNFLN